jgi:RNA polymerase sigma-70 factor (ECF subfamily)
MDGAIRLEIKNATLTDGEVVRRVLDGDIALLEIIMRRYNQRLFRLVRSIVKDDSQAEDIVQETYVRAYEHLSEFEGRAKFSTWLTKIAVYEAYARVRRYDYQNVDSISKLEDQGLSMKSDERDPERQTFDGEMKMLLERALDSLPDDYRSVFMLREVEGLSTAETAECLEISEENVKTRLHRARGLLQHELYSVVGATATTAFQFLGARCDEVVARVMRRIQGTDKA